jgi:hypothetical protein
VREFCLSGRVYVAVYLVASAAPQAAHTDNEVRARFLAAVRGVEWPYDVGDDPSFFCARVFSREGGSLTWGICRRDLRCPLQAGDAVAFFGALYRPETIEYCFSGYATVARKVTQADIWEDESLAVYRRYLNLLVSPVAEGFVHTEAHPGGVHVDWLWRLTCSRGRRWRARDFQQYRDRRCEMVFRPGRDRAANGEEIELAQNYVLFEPRPPATLLLAHPSWVASARRRAHDTWREVWHDDFRALRAATIGADRALRTSRTGFQHRHRSVEADAAAWRDEVAAVLQSLKGCGAS